MFHPLLGKPASPSLGRGEEGSLFTLGSGKASRIEGEPRREAHFPSKAGLLVSWRCAKLLSSPLAQREGGGEGERRRGEGGRIRGRGGLGPAPEVV